MELLTKVLSWISPSLGEIHGLPQYVFVVVIVLFLAFLLGYVIQGPRVWRQLRTAGRETRALKEKFPTPSREQAQAAFRWEPLKHLWSEYSETLHDIPLAGSDNQSVVQIRATVPAEAFFSREVLVDSRMFDEFTRHLPGVLTGLGILGTFAGLLDGLKKFDPSNTVSAVQGLKPLMEGVQHAFIASGIAIACAMIVVFVSRFVLAYQYKLVEELTHAIDSLYSSGAGEAYLLRLVKSSESNLATTSQLKDALVEDLRTLMTNLVERQIEAHKTANDTLSEQMGKHISDALTGPMNRIGEAIEVTTKGNGEQVGSMLETLLTAFMAKLEDTFGGQMHGINEQMQRSMDAMASVQTSLQNLVGDIKRASEQATNQMSGTLESAMKQAAENQTVLTDQMREFVQEFRKLAADEHAKSQRTMDDTIAKVVAEVASAVESLENVRKAAALEEGTRSTELTNRTGQLVGGLTTQVETLLNAMSDQVNKTQQNIDAFGQVSLRAIDGMNQGAVTMDGAARRFETAGSSVSTAFERSTNAAEVLASTSSALQTAASAVQRGFEQYDATRKNVDAQVNALMALVESAKREAGISASLIQNMKDSAEAMRAAEAESRKHLEQVNDALVKAFTDFGTSLVGQVKSAIAETDRHLSNGTGHLNGVVQELATAVHQMKRA